MKQEIQDYEMLITSLIVEDDVHYYAGIDLKTKKNICIDTDNKYILDNDLHLLDTYTFKGEIDSTLPLPHKNNHIILVSEPKREEFSPVPYWVKDIAKNKNTVFNGNLKLDDNNLLYVEKSVDCNAQEYYYAESIKIEDNNIYLDEIYINGEIIKNIKIPHISSFSVFKNMEQQLNTGVLCLSLSFPKKDSNRCYLKCNYLLVFPEKENKMHFRIENLGGIKEADINIGDLTLIAGENSTGKSYIAYSVWKTLQKQRINIIRYGRTWSSSNYQYTFDMLNYLIDKPTTNLILPEKDFLNIYKEIYKDVLNIKLTKKDLFSLYSDHKNNYENSKVYLKHEEESMDTYKNKVKDLFTNKETHSYINYDNNMFQINLDLSKHDIFIRNNKWVQENQTFNIMSKTYTSQTKTTQLIDLESRHEKKRLLNYLFIALIKPIQRVIFHKNFPTELELATTERSGALLFWMDDMNNKDELIEFQRRNTNILPEDLRETLNKSSIYVEPVSQNMEFGRSLTYITNKQSFLYNSDIIDKLEELMGGTLQYDDILGVTFRVFKKDSKTIYETIPALRYHMLSSSIRNLAFIYFYIKHIVTKKSMLIIDEPEAYLHPKNQIKMARILAMLVNQGIKVMITTHSDFIMREFSNLIMLNNNEYIDATKDIYKEYSKDMFLKEHQVEPYYTKQYENTNKYTLAKADKTDMGIWIAPTDEAIKSQNKIFNALNNDIKLTIENQVKHDLKQKK